MRNYKKRFTLLAGTLVAIGLLITSAAAPVATFAQQTQSTTGLRFEYSKSGGIAGINEKTTFDSKTGVIRLYKYSLGAVEKRLSNASVQAISDAIVDAKFFELRSSYPPKVNGAADYFSYSLAVTLDNLTHSVSWVDGFASSVPVPEALRNIANKIEQEYANASNTDMMPGDLGQRRITKTIVQESYSHNAYGHSSHQAIYFLSASSAYIYAGTVTFTTTKPVDILVYHDVTGYSSEKLKGLTVHVVNNISYAVSPILKNVTSGSVSFSGSKIFAHTLSNEPFTVVATIDVLRKPMTSSS